MIHRALARAALLLALLAPALGAQSPAERRGLQLLRDSLAIVRDTTALLSLEARTIDAARVHRDSTTLHLRLGLLALRLHELRGGSHLDDALSEFEWAVQLAPEWPWPWFGLGLAEVRGKDRAGGFAGGLWTMLGIDRESRAGAAFARAIRIDPSFTDGVVEFAELARMQRIDAPLREALQALRVVTATPSAWSAPLLLERGRIERLAGDPDSAAAAFRLAARLGLRPAIGYLELARTLPLTRGDTAGRGRDLPSAVAYFTGAASDDAEAVAMYRRDLEPIVDDTMLVRFDSLRGDARVAWLRIFWGDRDAIDLRPPGSRLAEHFRRWDVARREFRLPPFRRQYLFGIETFRSGDDELDDRGIVWLRQGEPTKRIVWPPLRGRPLPIDSWRTAYFGNETWRYQRPDGELVLHFAAREDLQDYKLVESVVDLDVSRTELEARAADVPGLPRLLTAGPASLPFLAEQERLRGRRSIGVATQSDAWERTYDTLLTGRAQWLAAGVRRGTPLVHLVFSIDADLVRRAATGTAGRVPVTVRAVFVDRAGRPVATLDTVQQVGRPGEAARLIGMRAEMPVPSGAYRVRFGVDLGENVGAVYPVDSLVVPTVTGPKLELSAVLIGEVGRSLPWEVAVGADTAWLDPANRYQVGDTVSVYAEAYGTVPGRSYKVMLSLQRQQGALNRLIRGRQEPIAITETITFPGSGARIRRNLILDGVEPGEYLLEFRVEGGGESLVRRRGLVVTESRRAEGR